MEVLISTWGQSDTRTDVDHSQRSEEQSKNLNAIIIMYYKIRSRICAEVI